MIPDLDVIDEPYKLTRDQTEFYRQHAFIKLKHVLPPDVLAYFGDVLTEKVVELNTMHMPLHERSTYDRAFLQVTNIWTKSQEVKRFVFSRRLAEIAADLMQVSGVRLYHDQALYKEPGGGFTPWHADQFYWPLSNDNTITAWIPLQETPLEMGPVEFAGRSHLLTSCRDIGIGDDSEVRIARLLDGADVDHVVEPFDVGEVSFHAGWLFHRAGPNATSKPRKVMCVIYMDEDMRLKQPANANQQADWDAWCPGASPGERIRTPLNPVLFTRRATG